MKRAIPNFIAAVLWIFLAIVAICGWDINYRLGYVIMAFVLSGTSILTGLRAWLLNE